MKRGTHIIWSLGMASVSLAGACTTETQGIKVRAIESASSKIKGGPAGLAEAQGLLNLGNPGLALEAFRKVQREQPSAAALAGIAACYAAMGRDDLAKANLEAALAFAPKAPELLQSVAVVMDRLDLKEEAATARHRAVEVAAQSAPIAAPIAGPKAERDDAPVVLAQPSKTPHPPAPPLKMEIAVDSTPSSTLIASLPEVRDVVRAVDEARRLVETQDLSASVTVKLPPARMASADPGPAAPRLERLSTREVALVTTAKPFWAPRMLKRTQTGLADPRWTPLRKGTADPNIRLLNAARIQGLASAARSGLARRGWRKIEVGDHADVRSRSIVLYPADKQRIGTSLARHFGIASAPSKGRTVTIILGRDIVTRLHG